MGIDRLFVEVSGSYSDTPHSVGLLWTSDQPVAQTSPRQHTTLKRQTSMSPAAGFKPTRPASKRLQTDALDRAATGIGTGRLGSVNSA